MLFLIILRSLLFAVQFQRKVSLAQFFFSTIIESTKLSTFAIIKTARLSFLTVRAPAHYATFVRDWLDANLYLFEKLIFQDRLGGYLVCQI